MATSTSADLYWHKNRPSVHWQNLNTHPNTTLYLLLKLITFETAFVFDKCSHAFNCANIITATEWSVLSWWTCSLLIIACSTVRALHHSALCWRRRSQWSKSVTSKQCAWPFEVADSQRSASVSGTFIRLWPARLGGIRGRVGPLCCDRLILTDQDRPTEPDRSGQPDRAWRVVRSWRQR